MKNKPILILAGDPKSIFFEIFFKFLKKEKKLKSPLILVASNIILKNEMRKFKFSRKIRFINSQNLEKNKLNNNTINLIDIPYNLGQKKNYLKECFDISCKILKTGFTNKFINGPITKTDFLNKKFLGITEYIAKRFKIKKVAMLIYNKELSVCPITTHLPLKLVHKKLSKKLIEEKVKLINTFYKKNFNFKPKIAITGMNPHCESILKVNEDTKIVRPAVLSLKNLGYKVDGPFPADTIFLKQNRKKFNVIIGMYHDQVISPLKTLKEYDAFNITLGLPFFRISPDHGPNILMLNKNKSNPTSLIKTIKFLDEK
tara:strand:+ start:804 stop:1748 length:945 start_codon:yes stop_codon:yes gene_type:complete